MSNDSTKTGRISCHDIPIKGALSVTALLDIEAKYNELRLILDCDEEITHKTAVQRLRNWQIESTRFRKGV